MVGELNHFGERRVFLGLEEKRMIQKLILYEHYF